jgi:hypothetical protein
LSACRFGFSLQSTNQHSGRSHVDALTEAFLEGFVAHFLSFDSLAFCQRSGLPTGRVNVCALAPAAFRALYASKQVFGNAVSVSISSSLFYRSVRVEVLWISGAPGPIHSPLEAPNFLPRLRNRRAKRFKVGPL